MSCEATDANPRMHCWHWTGRTVNSTDDAAAEERVCCRCGRYGLARAAYKNHGKFVPKKRGAPCLPDVEVVSP